MTLVLLALWLQAAPPAKIDVGIVRDVEIVEVNLGIDAKDPRYCRTLADAQKPCTPVGRRWRLKDLWRERALSLVNATDLRSGDVTACAGPTHALVLDTTQGKKVIEWNFSCHSVQGNVVAGTPTVKTEDDWAVFFHSAGLVTGLPLRSR